MNDGVTGSPSLPFGMYEKNSESAKQIIESIAVQIFSVALLTILAEFKEL